MKTSFYSKITLLFASFALINSCNTRTFDASSKSLEEKRAESAQMKTTPIFAFWDSGQEGLNKKLIQGGNVRNFLNQSPIGKYKVSLIHMNAAEYDENFFFEILEPSDYPTEMFQIANASMSLKSLYQQKLSEGTKLIQDKFNKTKTSEREIQNKIAKYAKALQIRVFMASKMTKEDLVQTHVMLGNSPLAQYNFSQKEFTDEELYKYAAVPLSDLVRLALLKKYGGFWIDTTVTINTNLDYYFNLLESSGKSIVMYYHPSYRQNVKSKNLANISAAETWWLATKEKNNPLVGHWLDFACNYWTQKTKSEDISEHPLFRKGNGVEVDVKKIYSPLRNYLWIYLGWARVVLEHSELAEKQVLAINAFENNNGPYSFINSNIWIPKIAEKVMELFAKEKEEGENLGKYLNWINEHKVIKVPGTAANALGEAYEKAGGIESKPNIYQYIWNKKSSDL